VTSYSTARHADVIHASHPTAHELDDRPAIWIDENSRGLEFASQLDWSSAVDAFAASADSIATARDPEPDAHEALALVLSNLAGACFHVGRVDDAIRHAQRAYSLRVALFGEDAVAVARLRSDLAVMLLAIDRADEASELITRAIVGIEQHAGDHDVQLVSALENGARVAIATGHIGLAITFVNRLHQLLSDHGLSLSRAESLRARIAPYVNEREHDESAEMARVAVVGEHEVPDVADVTGVADVEDVEVPIVIFDDDNEASDVDTFTPARPLDALRSITLAPVIEPPREDPAEAAAVAQEAARGLQESLPSSLLGFRVEYGFTGHETLTEHSTPDTDLGTERDAEYETGYRHDFETGFGTDDGEKSDGMSTIADVVTTALVPADDQISTPILIMHVTPPRVTVVMPTPSGGAIAIADSERKRERTTDARDSVSTRAAVEPIGSGRPPLPKFGRAAPGGRLGVHVAAAVAVGATAAVLWLFFHGAS